MYLELSKSTVTRIGRRLRREANYFLSRFEPLHNRHARVTYSSYGEDLVLENFFSRRAEPGFYIDVGANHPYSHSNTYLFYKRGWRGINFEPTPELYRLLTKHRPRDINLQKLVSNRVGEKRIFLLHSQNGENGIEPVAGEFAKDVQSKIDQYWHMEKAKDDRVEEKITMETVTLAAVLEQHHHEFNDIEFMNVDVEGFELEVLQSNDWQKFRPKMILVEDYIFDVEQLSGNAVHRFLGDQGYTFFSRNMITNFYIRDGVTRINV